MDHYTIVRGAILLVTIASIFAISVATLSKLIRGAAFFSERISVLVAVSLSVLFLVPFTQFLAGPTGSPDAGGSDGGISNVSGSPVLSGVALGVAGAVLLSQLLLLASKASPIERPEPPAEKPDNTVKPKPSGRTRKAKGADGESKETSKPQNEASEKELAPITTSSNEICRLWRFPTKTVRTGMELQCQ